MLNGYRFVDSMVIGRALGIELRIGRAILDISYHGLIEDNNLQQIIGEVMAFSTLPKSTPMGYSVWISRLFPINVYTTEAMKMFFNPSYKFLPLCIH